MLMPRHNVMPLHQIPYSTEPVCHFLILNLGAEKLWSIMIYKQHITFVLTFGPFTIEGRTGATMTHLPS